MPKSYHVIIIGAGPAGSLAAYHLAKGGLSVAVIEKEKLPRYKTCGGGLVYRALKYIPFDIQTVIEKQFHEVDFYMDGMHFIVKRTNPIISMVMRDRFDHLLVKEAQKQGADVYEQQTLEQLTEQDHSVKIITNKSEFTCNYVVGADGAYSRVAKLSGFKDGRTMIPALEYELKTAADPEREVRFDVGVLPFGYGWVFPKKNLLSVGVGHFKQKKIKLKKYYKNYLRQLKLGEILEEEQHGFKIPISPRGTYCRGRILLAGDAAGLADPVVAEGISNALLSGSIAAEAILSSFDRPQEVRSSYEKQLKKTIIRHFKKGLFAARLFYGYPRFRNWLFRKRGDVLSNWFTELFMGENIYPKGFHNYLAAGWKLLTKTPRRLSKD